MRTSGPYVPRQCEMSESRSSVTIFVGYVAAALCACTPVLAMQSSQARSVTTSDLARLVDMDGLSVSPDGRWAVIQARQGDPASNTFTLSWFLVPLAAGAPREVAAGGEPILFRAFGHNSGHITVMPPQWTADSRRFIYLRKQGSSVQLWSTSVDGNQTEQLSNGPREVEAFHLSGDGARILFQVGPDEALVERDLEREGRRGYLFDNRFIPYYSAKPVSYADFDLDSETSASSDAQRSIFVYDLRRGMQREATASEIADFREHEARRPAGLPSSAREPIAHSKQGALAWVEARDPSRQGALPPVTLVTRQDADSGPVVCAFKECTGARIAGAWWSNEREVVFARSEGWVGPTHTLHAWDVLENKTRQVLSIREAMPVWDQCAPIPDQLICAIEEPLRPMRLVRIRLSSGGIETLLEPNRELTSLALGRSPQPIEIRTRSGVLAHGYLTLPPQNRSGDRLPLVIVTYRCNGFQRGGVGDEYPILPFAASGFAVLCYHVPEDYELLETKGWADYASHMRGPGDLDKRRVQEGLEALVAELDRRGIADAGRIGVTGLSFGGETTEYALFNMPTMAAGISSGGNGFSPVGLYLSMPGAWRWLARWGLGDSLSERWNTLSLSHNAARVRAAHLVNAADHELLVSVQAFGALDQAGRSVEMYVHPDEYHIKWQPAHRLAIYNRNIDWMNFWLRGAESGLTGDSAQYPRWRAMRERQCRLFGPDGSERRGDDPSPWYCQPGALTRTQ